VAISIRYPLNALFFPCLIPSFVLFLSSEIKSEINIGRGGNAYIIELACRRPVTFALVTYALMCLARMAGCLASTRLTLQLGPSLVRENCRCNKFLFDSGL
jgi:hypothetical protein